jgi:hypothetical protein
MQQLECFLQRRIDWRKVMNQSESGMVELDDDVEPADNTVGNE